MKIPRKTNYKLVKRQRIRAAVHLHHWRKSYVGLHKHTGMFVKGIEMESGKYDWKDLFTVGYGQMRKGLVTIFSDPQPLTGEFKLYGIKDNEKAQKN